MVRVAVFISGGGSNMVSLLDDMAREGHAGTPCVVLANSANAGGLARAAERGVPTAVVDHRPFAGDRVAFEAAITTALEPYAPDMICLAGFMRILTAGFNDEWAGRMINIHPSLLPKYKGLHTHARALEAGDKRHGCSVHEVTATLDDGPILGQAEVPVLEGDTPETLAARVLVQEHRLYPAVLRRFVTGDRSPLLLQS
ncbi:phosphoribosylglycinamide formyltransferase [Sulfitobacter donghicola]|uniref:Phosphoribosylglycinamide formyltransferase n=1 Tax=Sulfitobacter donghicola DSW-25 = KCTC 12864 = JCM 14565 TaxID=1300350 RepID=A0A073IE15_9RHOB|nr:phosphoribosylglycinamide formyltransferase [Sulfitobacter donghicola]KEJ87969.1 phosphoribosylglycinamide formyltransferase [Sulfitobacter donghicola DSW-25 = KCTC 12864 = JCM 14565]KIN69479.1 Phosphoribosylglycinamide formyltransferase [Sulfitobacter donghicola DSW-25 = KCTC 12864 = JCM 14565]